MAFENYTQLPHLAPRPFWIAARVIVLAFTLGLIGWLLTGNHLALTVLWSLCIPLLPALWFVAPGLWRNVCPMAFLNQLPRELGFTRGERRPEALRTWAYPISIAVLLAAIALRPLLFNGSARASALLLAAALVAAFLGGLVFKGKSGWCGTFCPLAPVQKLYGQLPTVVVRNEYCSPCVGCQSNCYDFNPTAKLASDLYDRDQWGAGHRRFFAGIYPGFVLGYFTFAQFGFRGLIGFPLLSLGLFATIHAFTNATAYVLVVVWGMAAFATYYAFATPAVLHALGIVAPVTANAVEGVVALAALCAIVASVRHERAWRRVRAEDDVVRVADGGESLRAQIADAGLPAVIEQASGRRFLVQSKQTLLEAIENSGLHIETGCRMGMCGADPVLVVEGAEHMSPPGPEERSTLDRLGLAGRCRLACSAHVAGPVSISIDPTTVFLAGRVGAEEVRKPEPEPSIRVVIIGNGASGMSAAEHLRGRDPNASITVVSEEGHNFYNRMGIGRLIYGRSGLHSLALLEDSWYEEQRVDVWLNTRVNTIDRDAKAIVIATGETLPYDALVIATGASAAPLQTPGIEREGTFVLRTAGDAMNLRHWSQTHDAKRAVVAGGGVLGVEAADALRQLGIATTLIAREERLMERALDSESSVLLQRFLETSGIAVRTSRTLREVTGDQRVRGVVLDDGETIACDIVLSCIGIRPNAELARAAGLTVNRGIVVDTAMRTSDPAIFAVGDVAEVPGAVGGLWPVGKKQGEIAAATIAGEESRYVETHTMMHLKLAGIDVKCFGDVSSGRDDHRHLTGSTDPGSRWRRVVVRDGQIVGGVFVGESEVARTVAKALSGEEEHASVLAVLTS
ncbi:MAG TPA: FAD-dependent oxidoreductase [Candidatus Lustribacter sp.]|nr:FAD-dependent oxidoreductase [Candidatus Lustribacter sp.]